MYPRCGSPDLIYTVECEKKYEYDNEIKVIKRMHRYWLYKCNNCGETVRTGIAPGHRAECQYGVNMHALALSLMNTTNAAINKVPLLIHGLTNGQLDLCEGYVSKLQARAAKRLKEVQERQV